MVTGQKMSKNYIQNVSRKNLKLKMGANSIHYVRNAVTQKHADVVRTRFQLSVSKNNFNRVRTILSLSQNTL